MRVQLTALAFFAAQLGCLSLASAGEPLRAQAEPPRPRFNRLYDVEEIGEILAGYARAYPEWVRLETIGKSGEGRPLWLLTLTNPQGEELRKPGFYVDANIHANEVQGSETALYLLDFLLTRYGKLERVTELLDRSVFYFIPIVNPDGRARWFSQPATPHFPRTVVAPRDDDRDGLADEDGYDDLDGNGIITRMVKRVPKGEGRFLFDPQDPRLIRHVEGEEQGDLRLLGWEGVDNDGDGRVNEDALGYVDPNRTWGYDFQPRYIQGGASDYPLQIPETRAIAKWLLSKPNIAGGQSFHNAGRMILRGPGSKHVPRYPREDVAVYDQIAKEGERLLPGYRSMVIWKDLYRAHATTVDHLYMIHGAIAFTNELYSPPTDLDGDEKSSSAERMKFNDLLTLGRQFVPWTKRQHPQYGEVLVGGYRHDVGRVPEGWLLESECHRNAAFVLYHARQLPKLKLVGTKVRAQGQGLWRVDVTLQNERAIPSVSAVARQNKIHRLDLATLSGAKVIASGVVSDVLRDEVQLQRHRPERLEVPGVPSKRQRTLMFLVAGEGKLRFRYDSLKAGRIEAEVELKE
ncbi:MAG TPA: peptidase M14 [Planctomycetes bacterium]|nr:peptidase M14 [Planctomycetota bacterium]